MSNTIKIKVRCEHCDYNRFMVIYEENYLECGETIRLICFYCKTEQDYKAKGNLKHFKKK